MILSARRTPGPDYHSPGSHCNTLFKNDLWEKKIVNPRLPVIAVAARQTIEIYSPYEYTALACKKQYSPT
jgi:hypothetical protein